jgi:hypothetical protein
MFPCLVVQLHSLWQWPLSYRQLEKKRKVKRTARKGNRLGSGVANLGIDDYVGVG